MKFIATFYSHFGAIDFKKRCQKKGINASLQPVPRSLSSSCGTCVSYEEDEFHLPEVNIDEIEQIVEVTSDGYVRHFCAENS